MSQSFQIGDRVSDANGQVGTIKNIFNNGQKAIVLLDESGIRQLYRVDDLKLISTGREGDRWHQS